MRGQIEAPAEPLEYVGAGQMECDTLEEVVVAEQPLTEADDRTSIMAEATWRKTSRTGWKSTFSTIASCNVVGLKPI